MARTNDTELAANDTATPRTIDEARDELEATRRRIAHDLDIIEARLRGTAHELRDRLDLLQPARERVRANIWGSVALAFGAGVTLALLTGRGRHGRRRLPAQLVRKTAMKLPGALLQGARTGVATQLATEWHGRQPRTLPRAGTADDAPA